MALEKSNVKLIVPHIKTTIMRSIKDTIATVMAITLAIVILTNGTIFAADGSDKKVKAENQVAVGIYSVENTLKFQFAYENKTGKNLTISIYNEAGERVQKNTFGNKEGKVRYDLSDIGQGEYTVKIKAGDFRTERKIGIGVELPSEFNAYISSKLTNGKITLAYENAQSGAYISLTDNKGAILYSEHTTLSAAARKLNLSALEAGTYNLQLTSGDKTVEKIYTVK